MMEFEGLTKELHNEKVRELANEYDSGLKDTINEVKNDGR